MANNWQICLQTSSNESITFSVVKPEGFFEFCVEQLGVGVLFFFRQELGGQDAKLLELQLSGT